MLYAEVAMTIRRPRQDVAAVMFNPAYDTAWIGGVIRVRAIPAGPLRRGSRIKRETRILCRRVDEVREVTNAAPGRFVEMTVQSPLCLHVRYELEGIPEGTIARIRAEGAPPRRFSLLAGVINRLLRWAAIRNLDRLKALVESGAWRDLAA